MTALYSELAGWFHLLTHPDDYAEEAADYARILLEAVPAASTLLELGSGGGNNASHLKSSFTCTLTDVSPEMLDVSRGLNPECEHVLGDMRTLRLGRTFDAVFVHDAVMYLTSEADLRAAAETAFVHLRHGGAALFAPDCVRETFVSGTRSGGHDAVDGRSLRYIEWAHEPSSDTTFEADFAVLLREPGSPTRVVHDRHLFGLFPTDSWLAVLQTAGFTPRVEHAGHEGHDILFLGLR